MNTLIISAISFILVLGFSPSPALAQNLNILWDKTYSDSLLGIGTASSALPIADGFLICGNRYSPVSGFSGLLIKTDHNGNLLWRKLYPEIDNMYASLFDDSTMLIIGKIKPKSEYDNTSDIFTGLMDFNGNIRWIHRFTYWERRVFIAKRNSGICAFGQIRKDTSDLMAIQLNSNGDSISTHHFSLPLYYYSGVTPLILPNNKIVIAGVRVVGMSLDEFGTDYPTDPVVAIIDLEGSGSIHQQQIKLDWTSEMVTGGRIGENYFELLIARRYWSDSDSLRRGPDTTGLGVYRFDYSGNYSLIFTSTAPFEGTHIYESEPLADESWVCVGYINYGLKNKDNRLIHMNSKGIITTYSTGTPFITTSFMFIKIHEEYCFAVVGQDEHGLPRVTRCCVKPEVTSLPLDRSDQERPILTIRSGSLCIDYHKSHHPTQIEVYDVQGKKLLSTDAKEASDQIIIPFHGYPHGAYYAIIKTGQEVYTYPFYH